MTQQPGAPLTNPDHWRSTWQQIDHAAVEPDATFESVLAPFLPADPNRTALEIGCYPGNYMAWLSKRFGYRVSGLDFMADVESLRARLVAAGVVVEDLIEADFLKWEPPRQWDVVSSFGFIEHFEDVSFVLDKHLACLKKGGTLIIEAPHFRAGQWLLRRAFQPRLLDSHNLEAMRPDWYREQLEQRGLEVQYAGFFRTFEFWISPSGPRRSSELFNRIVNVASRLVQRGLARTHLDNLPNPWLSPYLLVVARKS